MWTGERLTIEDFGRYNLFRIIKKECEEMELPIKRELSLDLNFYEEITFNAVSYMDDSKSRVDISAGVLVLMYHHAQLVMMATQVIPELGVGEPYTGELSIWDFELPEIIPLESGLKQIAFYEGSNNPVRRRFGELTALLGAEFIAFHELGHHIGGHISYIKEKMGLQKLYLQNEVKCTESTMFQLLEMDADSIALCTLLENTMTKADLYAEIYLDQQKQLLPYAIVVALTLVFCLIEPDTEHFDKEKNKYLPRDFRFALTLDLFLEKIESEYAELLGNKTTEQQLLDVIVKANTIIKALYRHEKQNPALSLYQIGETGKYYTEVLLSEWTALRTQLSKSASITLAK